MRVQAIEINLAPASQAEASRMFSGLHSGDTVQAELSGVSGSRILIKTQDGRTIPADFRGNVQLQSGDMLELMMDARQGGRISLRLLSLNGQPLRPDVSIQENLLLRSGIDPTAFNVRLSGLLQQNGFLPTAQNISNLARILQEQPKLPADVSVFLAANNLKPDKETLRQINQLLSQAPQAGNRAQQLSDAVPRLFAEPKAASGQKAAGGTPLEPAPQSTFTAVPGLTRGHIQNLSGVKTENNTATANPEQLFRAPASFPAPDGGFAAIKDQLSGQNAALPGHQAKTTFAGLQSDSGSLTDVFKILASMPEQEAKTALAALAGKGAQNDGFFSSVLSFLNLPVQERKSLLLTLPDLPHNNLGWITGAPDLPQGLSFSPSVQEKTPGPADIGVQIPTGNAPDALPNAPQPGSGHAALDAAGQLLRKLDGLFLHLNPGDIPGTAEELRNSVQNQEKLAESVAADLSRLAGDKSALARQAGEIHAQVRFTSGLEQFYYFQIPVRFENRNNTAELYIFERNGKTKISREQSTVLIALETQNLGRVETTLRCEGSSLEVNFRLDSESFSNYLKEKASDLKQGLAESGFQVKNMQFGLIQKKTTLLNAQELFSRESRIPTVGLDIQV